MSPILLAFLVLCAVTVAECFKFVCLKRKGKNRNLVYQR